MIEKLELKHLAPYLPYNIKCEWKGMNIKVCGLNIDNDRILNIVNEYTAQFDEIKLILRPLSDIGDVPGKYLSEESNLDIGDQITLSELSNRKMNFAHLEYHLAVHLFENHFDCFGLIDAGLAVNINDLKK